MRRDAKADHGFTLIELLIAMLILLLITVPLVTSFILGVRTTREGGQDVQSSIDAQLLAGFFDIDVAGSEIVRTTAGGCAVQSGATPVLSLEWNDESGKTIATYATRPDPDMQAELALTTTVFALDRVVCSAAGAAGPTNVVARQLVQLGTVPPVKLLCDQLSTCGSTPRTLTLQLQESSKFFRDAGSTDTFSFGITAVRKVTP